MRCPTCQRTGYDDPGPQPDPKLQKWQAWRELDSGHRYAGTFDTKEAAIGALRGAGGHVDPFLLTALQQNEAGWPKSFSEFFDLECKPTSRPRRVRP